MSHAICTGDPAPPHRPGEREDAADACVFLASPMARRSTGHDLAVDGGMPVVVPAW